VRHRGFTLVEVIVALTIGAMAVILTHRLFTGVVDGTERLDEARRNLDREFNGRRWINESFGSLAVGGGPDRFTGSPHEVSFATWQRDEHGWLLRARVTLRHVRGSLVATYGSQEAVFADSVASLDFDYLLDPGEAGSADSLGSAPGAGARFVREWISPVSVPAAVRVRIGRRGDQGRVDTLLVIVGTRG
jgi:prepilin-type N-terminal cleavage/methylation domain-containing protein